MRTLDGAADAARALPRLQSEGALLLHDLRRGDFILLPRGDRRRRPLLRVSAKLVKSLTADGALDEIEPGARYRLSEAGHARAARQNAGGEGEYRAQHEPIGARSVVDDEGRLHLVRGVDPAGSIARLAKLTAPDGRRFLSPEEVAAANQVRADWEQGQSGLVRASDWSAPPRGAAGRGGGGGVEAARAGAVDARRRLDRALNSLTPMLALAVRAACLDEQALADIERARNWPARSGKLALKLGLGQLAEFYRRG